MGEAPAHAQTAAQCPDQLNIYGIRGVKSHKATDIQADG
jgi:hypothetical protein